MEEQTDDNKGNTYRKRSGTTDKGKEFENIMISHLALKLAMDIEVKDFKVSADDEEFGCFDDIVLESVSHGDVESKIAVQLKHSKNEKTLNMTSLSANSGNFSLKKYCASFNKLGERKINCQFVLLTNIKCKTSREQSIEIEGEQIKILQCQPDRLLNTSDNGRCYKFEVVSAANKQVAETYEAFFESFSLYTDQEHVDQLKVDVTRKFEQNFECSRDVVSKYFEFVSNWCKLEGRKEKLNMEFIKNALVLHLLSPLMRPFSHGPVSGNFEILAEAINKFDVVVLETKFEDTIKKTWSTTSGLEDVGAKIIEKAGRKYQLMDVLDDKQHMKLLWLLGRSPLIVKRSPSVYKSLQLCQHKTIVILDDKPKAKKLENSLSFRNLSCLRTYEDIHSNVVENFNYTFQGTPEVSLKFLLENIPEMETSITINDLLPMMDNYRIGGEKEDIPSPYIDRRLKIQALDSNNLTRFDEEMLIVVSCLEQNRDFRSSFRKLNLISVEESDKNKLDDIDKEYSEDVLPENHQINKLGASKKVIYVNEKLCSAEQFDAICTRNANYTKCHHFKIRTDGLLEWVQSKGDTTDLEKYVKEHNIDEVELCCINTSNSINIIIADPGMGKSVLLKNIKNNISPQFVTVILDPDDISVICKQLKQMKNYETEDLMELIFGQKFKASEGFEVKILKFMRNKRQIVIMWDALDDLTKETLDTATKIVLQLSKSGIKQLVTARPHLKKTLETKFDVPSKWIRGFEIHQQKFYIRKRLAGHCSEQDVNAITDNIIDNLHFARHIDVIGVPLQIFMLTELIIRDSDKYLKKLGKTMSLSDLFTYFIEEKFNVYFYEKLKMDVLNHAVKIQVDKLKVNAMENFQKAALLLLMGKEFLQQLSINFQDVLPKIKHEEGWYGLLAGIRDDGLPVFIHNSYAEYFVADYFARNYKNNSNFKNINILFKEKYTNIRLLFDMLLAKDCPVHIAAIYRHFEHLQNCGEDLKHKDKGGRSALHLASSWAARHSVLDVEVKSNCYQLNIEDDNTSEAESPECQKMLEYLLNKCDPLEKDEKFNMDSLSYAKMSDSLYVVGTIIKNKKFDHLQLRTQPKYMSNIYYYAAKFGYENLMDIFEDATIISTSRGETLLHICATYNQEPCLRKLMLSNEYKAVVNDGNQHHESPLHIACRYGHVEVVKLLIASKANTNAVADWGNTPLHLATQNGRKEVVNLLIESSAKIDVASTDGWTPLHSAAQNGHIEVVELLIAASANVDPALNSGWTPLHLASQHGYKDVVNLLIESSANCEANSNGGWTPLHLASQYGHTDVVKFLLASSANVEVVLSDGWTPLLLACENGHAEVVNLLIVSNANIHAATNWGLTPLHLASQKGHCEVANLMIESKADINAVTKWGKTPLHLASQNGCTEVVNLLIVSKAEIHATTTWRNTPLHLASQKGHWETVNLLIESCANIEAISREYATPLHVASQHGHTEVVKLLIAASANVDAALNGGWTALHLASQNGHTEIVNLLVASSSNVEAVAYEEGWTPLLLACESKHAEVVKLLISAKANIHAVTNWGNTPLHLACQNGHLEVVKLLIKSNAYINAVTNLNKTALHLASKNGHTKVVDLLIFSKADVHAVTSWGNTPLHLASQNGHTEVVGLLIAAKANIDAPTNWANTPLHLGAKNGHTEVVKLLIGSNANVHATTLWGDTPLYLASNNGHMEVVNLLS